LTGTRTLMHLHVNGLERTASEAGSETRAPTAAPAPGEDLIDQVGGGLRHAPGAAGGTKSTPLAGKGHELFMGAVGATQAQEAVGWFILRLLAMWVDHWVKKTLLFVTSG
jgi:hypothetical protein